MFFGLSIIPQSVLTYNIVYAMSSPSRRRRGKTPPRTPAPPRTPVSVHPEEVDGDGLTTTEVVLLEENRITRAQLRRALSFVDVTGDGKITSIEISGALMATDMEEAESQRLTQKLMGGHEASNKNEIRGTWVQLLGDDDFRETAKIAIMKILHERDDMNDDVEFHRFVVALLFWLMPFPFVVPYLREPFAKLLTIGPEYQTIYVPNYYRVKEKVWSTVACRTFLQKLNRVFFSRGGREEHLRLSMTNVVIRVFPGGGLDSFDVRLTLKSPTDEGKGRPTPGFYVQNVVETKFANFLMEDSISCEDPNTQVEVRNALRDRYGNISYTVSEEEENEGKTRDGELIEYVITKLKKYYKKNGNGDASESEERKEIVVGVWELRLRCVPREDWERRPDNRLCRSHSEEKTINNLRGSEVVYQHDSTSVAVFESTSLDGLDIEEVECLTSLNSIAHSVVHAQPWFNMAYEAIFLAWTTYAIGWLGYCDTSIWSTHAYACSKSQAVVEGCETFDRIVSHSEITRLFILFIVVTVLNSFKNRWNVNGIKTKQSKSAEDDYINTYDAIVNGPKRVHEDTIGRMISVVIGLTWCLIPLFRRVWRNGAVVNEGLGHEASVVTLFNPGFYREYFKALGRQEVLLASLIGVKEGEAINTWPIIDQFCLVLCLFGVAIMLASCVTAAICSIKDCCSKKSERAYRRTVFERIILAFCICLPLLLYCATCTFSWSELFEFLLVIAVVGMGSYLYVHYLLGRFFQYALGGQKIPALECMDVLALERLLMMLGPSLALAVTVGRLLFGMYVSELVPTAPADKDFELPLSMRFIITWSSLVSSFLLTSTLAGIMYHNFCYFQKIGQTFELFTESSAYGSWYRYLKRYIKHNPSNHDIIHKIRILEPFDFRVPEKLKLWSRVRDILVKRSTSTEADIRHANLQMMFLITFVLFGFNFANVYFSFMEARSTETKIYGPTMQQALTYSSEHQVEVSLTFWLCTILLMPLLYVRKVVQQEHEKQLTLLQFAKNRLHVARLQHVEDVDEEQVEALDVFVNKLESEKGRFVPKLFGFEIMWIVSNVGWGLTLHMLGVFVKAETAGYISIS